MTTHYIDITLRPDPEFSPAHLLNALFSKLHRALVQLGTSDVGISFPALHPKGLHLGATLRMHGTESALSRLQALPWLQGMRDHVLVGDISPAPPGALHRVVSRVQARSSPARQRRRQMRRHGYDEAEALRRVPDAAAQRLENPYITLQSASTHQVFRLFIEHGPPGQEPHAGTFSTYGLSAETTIPWF